MSPTVKRIHECLIAVALLVPLSTQVAAQHQPRDYARIHRLEPVDTPAAWPEVTIDVPDGTVPGMLLGGAAGLVAALPVFLHSECGECMISPAIVFPIWAAGGVLVGGVSGAALTAAYYPRGGGGNRHYEDDVISGALIGLVVGTLGVVAASEVWSPWSEDGLSSDDPVREPIMIGMAAPLFTLVGAITGAIVDASGGDVPCLCGPPADEPSD